MSKPTESGTVSVGHAGQAAGALVHGGRRILLIAAGAVGVVLLAASVAFACTTYWGQITIENLDDSNGEFSVVADPTSGMDRCDGAMDDGSGGTSGGTASAHNGKGSNSGSGPDTVRVEISKWEPGGEDPSTEPDCEVDDDGDHKLPDGTDGAEPVYVNTYDGDAYEDSDGDGVYEDNDDAQGPFDNAGNETHGEVSSERIGDCMGDGSASDVINHDPNGDGTSAIGVTSDGQFDGTNKDVTHNGSADQDGDGVNDVDITIDQAPDTGGSSTDFAGAICVSEGDGEDSAPQIPIEIL